MKNAAAKDSLSRICRSPAAALLATSALLAVTAGTAVAAQPSVSHFEPTGVRRGEETTVVVHGVRLSDARQVLFDEPGLTAISVKPLDNRKAEMVIKAAPDCRPGLHPVRVITASGIAPLRLLSVGTMPTVAEAEPNSDFASPQVVPLNTTISGVIEREDEDYFAVDLKAGQRLSVEVEGARLWAGVRNDFFDPFVAILDAERFEQAVSDDAALLQQDCFCSITAKQDGRYVVLIRDSSYGGTNDARYRLHLGSFPRPVATLPSGGAAGDLTDMQLISEGGEIAIASVQLPSQPVSRFPVVAENEAGVAPSPNWTRVSPFPNVLETEPNNSTKEPTAGPLPAAFCGMLAEPGDIDYYSFEAKKGQKIAVTMFGRNILRSPIDGVVNVYAPDGKRITGNDDGNGPDSVFEFDAPADGVHLVRIEDHLGAGGPAYTYRIEVEPSKPNLELGLQEERRDEAATFAVPQGGRAAAMVTATRRHFGGELAIEPKKLPTGATAEPFAMPANRTLVPLLISADAEAPLGAELAELTARHTGDSPAVEGHLLQRNKLLLGQNRRDVYGYDADRVPVAVVEKLPVKLEIVQPQVPIVRGGSMPLTVRVEREEGFNAEIPVRLLYNPPGIGSSRSVKIAEGANEAQIPMTANGSAAIGQWPLIAIAQINTGNGSVELATKEIMLEIADSFFNFTINKASVEQGQQASVLVNVEVKRPFEGTAEVTLQGLPAGVSSSAATQPLTAESTEAVFPIEIAADARPGQHKTLVCQATITAPNGAILQTQGTGEVQVNEPLPAETAAAKPKADKPAAAPEKKPEKPLSRLEQLRQMKAQAE